MGQAKRRKDQLGALYGTPEGSNRPREAVWHGLSEKAQILMEIQATADADGRDLAAWVPDPDAPDELLVRVSANPPEPEPEQLVWVPPTKPGAALAYRHPVWVERSGLTGKWAVMMELSKGAHVLDVFLECGPALRSAQNAQEAFAVADARVDGNSDRYHDLVMTYAAADESSGIQSDDEILAETEPGEEGFRVLRNRGSITGEQLGQIVDRLRQSGIHARMP
jgi:hypothetical protein